VLHKANNLLGTRLSIGYLKFGMSLGRVTVESELSDPLIVISNESQWVTSIGALIKQEAFSGNLQISWEKFANTLQLYFLVCKCFVCAYIHDIPFHATQNGPFFYT